MPILQIHHLTRYRYRQPVGFGEHRMMFRPRESYDQRVLESRLLISPEPSQLRYVQDVFGNCVGVARFGRKASELCFESTVRLDHEPHPLLPDVEEEIGASWPYSYEPEDMADLRLSIESQYADPDGALRAWANRFVRPVGRTKALALLVAMTHAIREEFTYSTRLHGPAQSPAETLSLKSGSCRDFAVLMMEAVRSLGLAARFVSGYIYSPRIGRGDVRRLGGGHTHAWVRVYLPSCGWVEFDPTNGIVGNTDLIRVAVARDPVQAVPLHGCWFGAPTSYKAMDVSVNVTVEDEPVALTRVPVAAVG